MVKESFIGECIFHMIFAEWLGFEHGVIRKKDLQGSKSTEIVKQDV
jgi:hypothetical protein